MTDDRRAAGVPLPRRTDHLGRRPGRTPAQRCLAGRAAEPAVHFADPSAAPAEVEITALERRSGVLVVEVSGEIDLRTADRLRNRLLELGRDLMAAGGGRLVVDFGEVAFCDATGLGSLVAVANELRARGGRLHLARVRPAQHRLLLVTGLERLIPVHETVAEAAGDRLPSSVAER
jgi:anti-sigma B factor antagonist